MLVGGNHIARFFTTFVPSEYSATKMRQLLTIISLLLALRCHAQQPLIRETITNDFVPSRSTLRSSNYRVDEDRIGVQSMARGEYRDSIARYFDRIEEYHPMEEDTIVNRYYRVIFGQDTLCYKLRKSVIRKTYAGQTMLEVESSVAPHQRFEVAIDGLSEEEVVVLKRQMQQMKSTESLKNNVQTCIFYALNLLLDSKGINPAPIITRNTNFTDGRQLNGFFNHILLQKGSCQCQYKVLQELELDEDCVLVFRNAHNEYIHALFYRSDTDEYYTKNGMTAPFVLNDLRQIVATYGRYDKADDKLSAEALDKLADTVLIFGVDE